MACDRPLTYFPSGALDNSWSALTIPILWYGNASLPSEPDQINNMNVCPKKTKGQHRFTNSVIKLLKYQRFIENITKHLKHLKENIGKHKQKNTHRPPITALTALNIASKTSGLLDFWLKLLTIANAPIRLPSSACRACGSTTKSISVAYLLKSRFTDFKRIPTDSNTISGLRFSILTEDGTTIL